MKVGDRIGYTAKFVRDQCGGFAEYGERRGTVLGFRDETRAHALVQWDDNDAPSLVAVSNIAVPGTVSFSDPHASLAVRRAV